MTARPHPSGYRAASGRPPARRPPSAASASIGSTLGILVAGFLVVLAAACAGDPVAVPGGETPYLYLVLGERTVALDRPGEPPAQHAVLLTLPAPTQPARYRAADRFDMTDETTGSAFSWTDLGLTGTVESFPGMDFRRPNYRLPNSPTTGLGSADLTPLGSYALEIRTGGRIIRGRVTVPAQITARLDGRTLSWAPVAGAAGYRVMIDRAKRLVTDTVLPLSEEELSATSIVVDAMDPNLWQYLTREVTSAPDLNGAHGVLGAITRDTVR